MSITSCWEVAVCGRCRSRLRSRRTEATSVVVGLTCVGKGLIMFGFSHLVYCNTKESELTYFDVGSCLYFRP